MIEPSPAFDPPYYVVVFVSLRTETDKGYLEAAQRMQELAEQQPGFLGIDSARVPGALGITVSYWRDEESIKGWRENLVHAKIRDNGRANWYESFTTHVAKVDRSYAFDRNMPEGEYQAP